MTVELEISIALRLGDTTIRVAGDYEKGTGLVLAGSAEPRVRLVEFLGRLATALGASQPEFPDGLPELTLDGIDVSLAKELMILEGDLEIGGPAAGTLGLTGIAKRAGGGSKLLAGIDLEKAFDLSHLPLVGRAFPEGRTPSLDGLQLVVAAGKTSWSEDEVKAVNRLLVRLPRPSSEPARPPFPEQRIAEGVGLGVLFRLGDAVDGLLFQAGEGGSATDSAPSPPPATAKVSAPGTVWVKVQRTLGPVYVDKVGMAYHGGALALLLDASLTAAGMTLSLEGLAVGSRRLWPIEPTFDLQGLGLDLRRGPLEIGGAFVKGTGEAADGAEYTDYSGEAVLALGDLRLAALGSYADPPGGGGPSLFAYGALGYPLGGPPFCFVTGLAAGFGYHRSLTPPALAELPSFPLVAAALSGAEAGPQAGDLAGMLAELQEHITVDPGEDFLAAGVRFSSFEMLDSFALLTASFGERFEIDVLGLSTMIVPTPEGSASTPALAEAQLALEARYVPDEGLLGASGQLTPASWILDKSCRLTGGFAFYSWLDGDYAGDFVVTLGGYHPKFAVPAHYPNVPRLGIHWQVSSEVSITGNAYYALTPSTLMAGGCLSATWSSGPFAASFTVGADFMIDWLPYHYSADAHVGISASYTYHFFGTHHLTVGVGANLSIWGPEFSGRAHVDLHIVSFDVAFGAGTSQRPQSIGWDRFQEVFLPPAASPPPVVGVSIGGGLVRTVTAEYETWIVNPQELVLVTNSRLPSTDQTAPDGTATGAETSIGLKPMGVAKIGGSTHNVLIVRVTWNEDEGKQVLTPVAAERLAFTPVLETGPRALWGDAPEAPETLSEVRANLLTGYRIAPVAPQAGHKTASRSPEQFEFDASLHASPIAWVRARSWNPVEEPPHDREAWRVRFQDSIGSADPASMERLLGVAGSEPQDGQAGNQNGWRVDVDDSFADDLVAVPQIGGFEEAS